MMVFCSTFEVNKVGSFPQRFLPIELYSIPDPTFSEVDLTALNHSIKATARWQGYTSY
jgi:hypothetical protein